MAALEARLPPEVRALADWRGGEAAWRRCDVPRLAEAARAAGLACLGGQAQLRLAGRTFELYWQDYDPGPRRADETREVYVDRSWAEALFLVRTLPADAVMVEGARKILPDLAAVTDAEALAGLWLVVCLGEP